MIRKMLGIVRPDKTISKDIPLSGLLAECLYFATCTIRSLWFRVRGVRATLFFAGRGVSCGFAHRIHIGRFVRIGDYCILGGLGREGLFLGDGSSIGAFCRLVVSTDYSNPGAYIRLGKRVGLGEYSSIGGSGGVSIGDDTIIAQYFSAHPENHSFDNLLEPIRVQGTERAPISIGSGCWIGAKVTVLAGVTVGDGAVIGAGSVVVKDVPPNAVVVGNPARFIRFRGVE
jgi:acetyltransferase-like isoleucine patch superfamily enzyme